MTFDVGKFTTGILKVGQNLTNQAMTFSVMKDMNRGNSIFPQGGFYGAGMWGQSFGCGCSGIYGGYNPNEAYMRGAMQAEADMAAITASLMQKGSIPTQSKKADAVKADQDTKMGENFEKATKSELGEDDKSFSFLPESWKKLFAKADKATPEEQKELIKGYRDGASEIGKSYLKHMDKSAGNNDGYISEDEFVKYSLENDLEPLKSDATEEEKNEYAAKKKEAEAMARAAYKKMDQNQDKSVDWKEMAAMFSAVDQTNKNDGINGEISSAEFKLFSQQLGSNTANNADVSLRSAYKNLFSQE